MNWSEFFHMGGYGFYVWFSYGLAFVVLVANVVIPRYKGRSVMRELVARQRRGGGK